MSDSSVIELNTPSGDISVKIPKARDRSSQGIKFNSSLVSPYLSGPRSWKNLSPGCI
ncbi:MAG: hypothetical protein V3U62_06710 [Sedimenticolaceae bacterium]